MRFPRGAAALLCGFGTLCFASCTPDRLVFETPRGGDAWRMYGGGGGRANAAASIVEPPLEPRWRYNAGAGFGPSSVSVADSTVFAATLAGEVRALSLAGGEETGTYDFGAALFGAPALLGARMVVGVSGEEENLVCFNLRSGRIDWAARTGDIESSVLWAGDRIVAAMVEGAVAAWDTGRGVELWRYTLPRSPRRPGIRSSPSTDGERVFVGTDAGEVIALGLADGDPVWTSPRAGAVFAPTAVASGRVFACGLDGAVRAFDAATGTALWSFDAGAPLYGGVAVAEDLVIFGVSGGGVAALRSSDGSVAWRAATEGGVGAAPVVSGGTVYTGDLRKRLYAFDLMTGTERWSAELDGRVRATPVAAGGMLVVLAEDRMVLGFGGGGP